MTEPVQTRPLGPASVEYVRLAVPDMTATIEFLSYHVGLALEEHDESHAYLRVGTEHHSVELLHEPSLSAFRYDGVGYSVDDDTVLADLEQRVRAAGHEVLPLTQGMKGLCQAGFAVRDPNGTLVELFTDFIEYAETPWPDLRPQTLVHPFIITDRYDETLAFYLDVLGFQASDYVEDFTAFLRCEDRYHHSLAVRRSDRFALEHLCFIMGDMDGVMRRRARAQYRNVKILGDVVNHSASTSIAFYLYDDQHGPRYELCDGHRIFTPAEHETHRPRRLKRDPRNIDVWRAEADDRTWAH
ncbi:VOC family protein [Rhodococcus sp. X156]|uniref:VOC family protein n=1 Tax=Rhodococcus sp. X156 TaxID=2499145 RepID=UPI000FDAE32C|nr:VOC family protein [Rhodococcus sp. X156]